MRLAMYGPWRAKITSILDAEDLWELVCGEERELGADLAPDRDDLDDGYFPRDVSHASALEDDVKAWKKRSKRAAQLISLALDDSIVMTMDVHRRNPVSMWAQLAAGYNMVTPAKLLLARKDF